MNRERVQMLRDMMEGIPEKNVVMRYVYSNERGQASTRPDKATCETIACMAGWAALYPPLVKEGFQLTRPWCEFFDAPEGLFSKIMLHESGTDKEIALKRLDALLEA